jgi:AraC-like DNA-binding protein
MLKALIRRRENLSNQALEDKMLMRFNELPDIRSIGRTIFDPIWARNNHVDKANELLHIVRGNVVVRMGKRQIAAGPGDILLVPAGIMHRDDFDLSVGLEVFMIFFHWLPGGEYFRLVSPESVPGLCKPMAAEINRLYGRMQMGLDAGTEVDKLMIGAYTHIILLMILRATLQPQSRDSAARNRHGRVLLLQARQYIDSHYAEQLSLELIAAALRISPFYLSHLFSREREVSFVEYLTQVRMQNAKKLLAEGGLNVSEAAYAVGYQDSGYFSKVFHRYFGVSPKAARCAMARLPQYGTARKSLK